MLDSRLQVIAGGVLCRFEHGVNPEAPFAHGVAMFARAPDQIGADTAAESVRQIALSLFLEWPGLSVDEYEIADGADGRQVVPLYV